MKVRVLMVLLLMFCFMGTTAVAVQNRGNKEIKIDGGKRGSVSFFHHMHQNMIKDCSVCHSLFPKSKGAIKNTIAEKKLKKKQVMTTVCLKCHKDYKKAGKAHGPTKCSACHVK